MAKKYFEGRREELLFRYAIIADTHFLPEQGDESSPWEVNKYANDRARWIIDQINRSNPDFVIHMGDIVHPLPHLATYGSAAEAALKAFNEIKSPIRYIPGNHDVGDKNNPMMPAYTVDDLGLNIYMKWFGPLHQSFDHKDIHFIMINTQVLNSGLAHEPEHSRWLEADLKANRGKRIHLFSHYPPYVLEPREPSNYDNIDEPARSWLIGLLERYEVEALFAGHVHNFLYQKHGITECYNIPATSFVRQDYSEMFRIEAADEYGRNDVEKLGWCIVDIYESTHILRTYRSSGAVLPEGETSSIETPKVDTYHTKDSVLAPIGVHLRHPWAEEIDLPYNGPLDEFIRKRVRNDYLLLGLWECGIRKLRVPLSDLVDKRTRVRMYALTGIGHRFNVFSFGIPLGDELEVLKHHPSLVNIFEIILPWRDAEKAIPDLLRFRKMVPVPLFIANIESSADQKHDGSKFRHYVSYGFRASNIEGIKAFMGFEKARDAADGFVFRIGADESPWDAVQAISTIAASMGLSALANVRLASENPAEYLSDDIRVANRVAEAMVAATATKNVEVFLDTFVDLDRGYFPRIGLYDRRYNRRLGSLVFAHLQGVLNKIGQDISLGNCRKNADGKTCVFEIDQTTINLFLPYPGKAHRRRIALQGKTNHDRKGKAELVNLASGTISEVMWNKSDQGLVLLNSSPCRIPSLFILKK